jgi:hypothetical protein
MKAELEVSMNILKRREEYHQKYIEKRKTEWGMDPEEIAEEEEENEHLLIKGHMDFVGGDRSQPVCYQPEREAFEMWVQLSDSTGEEISQVFLRFSRDELIKLADQIFYELVYPSPAAGADWVPEEY